MNTTQFEDQLVLIAGGSSGIGLALAKDLSSQGAHVWILARRQQVLQTALEQIRQVRIHDGQRFGALACDLTDRTQLEDTLRKFQGEIGTPDVLIYAAGYAHPDVFLNIEPDVFYRQMDVNYFGAINTIRAFLPAMIERNSGHILNICSVAGFLTFYGYSAYSPTKFALRGFSDALRSELKFTNIKISIAFPPDTDTPGFETENRTKPEITKEVSKAGGLAKPEAVARSILQGMQRNRYLIITGFENNLFFRLNNLLGGWMYPIMDILVSSAARKTGKK